MEVLEMFKCCGCKSFFPRMAFGGIKKRCDYCLICARKWNREYAILHREERNAQNRRCAAKRYRTNRAQLIDFLQSHPCVDCGEDDIVVLEFDHRDPAAKRATIASVLGSWTWKTIEAEIAKCDVRCANCHRRRTSRQFGWFKEVMPDVSHASLD